MKIENMLRICDGFYVGVGAKVLGKLTADAEATIGADAVVTKDVLAGVVVIGANRII